MIRLLSGSQVFFNYSSFSPHNIITITLLLVLPIKIAASDLFTFKTFETLAANSKTIPDNFLSDRVCLY